MKQERKNTRIVARIIRVVEKAWFSPLLHFADTQSAQRSPWAGFANAHTAPYRKFGFTLAEVLITLGIIGVVAAMTLPALIAKWQNLAYVAQLQKTVNTLDNGFKLALAEDGVDNLEDTKLFQSMSGISYSYRSIDESFEKALKKYFNIVSYSKGGIPLSALVPDGSVGDTSGTIVMADGSIIRGFEFSKLSDYSYESCQNVKAAGGKMCSWQGNFLIDVNGDKKPNTLGRDVFHFYLSGNGIIVASASKDYSIYANRTYKNKFDPLDANYWASGNLFAGCIAETTLGYGCAARIIENGWKMDY